MSRRNAWYQTEEIAPWPDWSEARPEAQKFNSDVQVYRCTEQAMLNHDETAESDEKV